MKKRLFCELKRAEIPYRKKKKKAWLVGIIGNAVNQRETLRGRGEENLDRSKRNESTQAKSLGGGYHCKKNK